ncbi:MAG: phytanoyl-CoA dioxygenase family protein [Myxococcota bacterium]|nr:phytanoyl-CoA dioxygenase family protein [Myxococcota bacterium]
MTSPICIPLQHRKPGQSLDDETAAHAARVFRKYGACLLENMLLPEQVDAALAASHELFEERRSLAGDIGLGLDEGYREIVQRMKGRYDLWIEKDAPVFRELIHLDTAPWGNLIHRLLLDSRMMSAGVLMTLPGAAPHPWHNDGPPLFNSPGSPVLPPHCINVFIPLVDQTIENGGTELRLGTHLRVGPRKRVVWSMSVTGTELEELPFSLVCPAGSVLLFDYRLQHRANPHNGTDRRVVLYYTYALRWFIDHLNLPENSLYP